MYHKRHVDAVEISATKELSLSAEIFYDSTALELGAVLDLKQLLGRYGAKANATDKSFEHVRFPERCGNTEQCGTLRVMSAGMNGAGLGIALGMFRAYNRVKLAKHEHLGALSARIDDGVKSRNVPCHSKRISKLAEALGKIRARLHLTEPGLRRAPYPTLCFKDQLFVFFNRSVYCFHFVPPQYFIL